MMKKISFVILISLLAGLSSCNKEDDWLDSFPKLDDAEYSFYVADALDVMNMPRPEGSYKYPCLPGMPTWKELNDQEEMDRVCRVPEKILKKQSTQAVIQALWEHPFFPVLIAASSNSSIQRSLDRALEDWDIYLELIKRSDAASCLVERYGRMNLTKGIHTLYVNSLQLILTQTVFLDQLSFEQKRLLAKEMIVRMEELGKLLELEENQKLFTLKSSSFCLVRIMANSGYEPMLTWMKNDKSIQDFEKWGDVFDLYSVPDFSKTLLELSSNFINNNN